MAVSNIQFILDAQRDDGSWWYALSSDSDQFIDNFHTCLVLKNLVKANIHLQDMRVWKAIERGYEYYQQHLIDSKGEPIPFASLNRTNLVSRDMYDYAEGINLGILISRHFPPELDDTNVRSTALKTASNLASTLIQDYQLADGHFISKVYLNHIPNTVPYIRWAQSQILHALTMYLEYSTILFGESQSISVMNEAQGEVILH